MGLFGKIFWKKSPLEQLNRVESAAPEITGVEWARMYDVEYDACTRCGAEWGHSIYGNERWPQSVKKRVGKQCRHTAAGTTDIGKVVSVDTKGAYLVLAYEKCRLCSSIHSPFFGRIDNGNKCPKCKRQLGVNYKDIGYASETVYYLCRRDAL
jgi:hypothetical protein